MKISRRKTFTIIASIILIIAIYALFQSYVNAITYIKALNQILNTIISETWKFVSSPTIFIALVISVLIVTFRENILSLFPAVKEITAGSFSAKFDYSEAISSTNKTDMDTLSELDERKLNESEVTPSITSNDIANYWISRMGPKTTQFILDSDGGIYSVRDWVNRISEIMFVSPLYKSGEIDLEDKETLAYYFGVYRTFQKVVMPHFFSRKVSDDRKTGYFELLPGLREPLLTRLEELSHKVKEETVILD